MATRKYEQKAPGRGAGRDPAAHPRCGRASGSGTRSDGPGQPRPGRPHGEVSRRSTIYLTFGSRARLQWFTGRPVGADRPRGARPKPCSTRRETTPAGRRARGLPHVRGRPRHLPCAVFDGATRSRIRRWRGRKMNTERIGGMEHLARRLREDGRTRDDVSIPYATNVFWMHLQLRELRSPDHRSRSSVDGPRTDLSPANRFAGLRPRLSD